MNPQLLKLTPELEANSRKKADAAAALLATIARDFAPATFANSLGAEDMVLTDLIRKHAPDIEIFSLDTGRLNPETYTLMAKTEQHYGIKLQVYYPQAEPLQQFVRSQGINAFYESVEMRKGCCGIRKVEPLKRALAGKKAWITGMRAEQSATRTTLAESEFDAGNGLQKFNPLANWTEKEVWTYLLQHKVPYNTLHEQFYPSIGCAPCTRAISPGEDVRSGRWWWENPDTKECGLHLKTTA